MFYWLSWVQPGSDHRPLTDPPNESIRGWWIERRVDNGTILYAMVKAPDEQAAKAVVNVYWPEAVEWLFCTERATLWKDSPVLKLQPTSLGSGLSDLK